MTATKREVALITIVLVLALLGARMWQLAREGEIRAEATAAANQQIVDAKNAAIKDRDVLNKAVTDTLHHQSDAVQTPQQAAKVVVQYMPAPAQTPIVTVAKADLPTAIAQQLPDAPSYQLMTGPQLEQIAKDELTCDATRHDLTTCMADSADLHTELAAQKAETDAWKTAAKGGSRWHRFGRVVRSIGCAAGGAGIGALITKSDPLGPTAGAAAGVTACSFIP